ATRRDRMANTPALDTLTPTERDGPYTPDRGARAARPRGRRTGDGHTPTHRPSVPRRKSTAAPE
ncbi:hypothetical protein, partial [Streptomyces sp. FH025]|uniref:hypothetical protein n=1 Tax=Streptomyces sp. FH025 TaxID=2815937 RepID=UPI001A9E0460